MQTIIEIIGQKIMRGEPVRLVIRATTPAGFGNKPGINTAIQRFEKWKNGLRRSDAHSRLYFIYNSISTRDGVNVEIEAKTMPEMLRKEIVVELIAINTSPLCMIEIRP